MNIRRDATQLQAKSQGTEESICAIVFCRQSWTAECHIPPKNNRVCNKKEPMAWQQSRLASYFAICQSCWNKSRAKTDATCARFLMLGRYVRPPPAWHAARGGHLKAELLFREFEIQNIKDYIIPLKRKRLYSESTFKRTFHIDFLILVDNIVLAIIIFALKFI